MAEKTLIIQTVEQVVSQVLENHLPRLKSELTGRVMEELGPHLGGGGADEAGAGNLLKAITDIHTGTTQKEILRALLDHTARYSGRAALFVVKGGAATGWQGRGFDNNDDVKDFALDMSSPAPLKVMEAHAAAASGVSEMDPKFISQFGAPTEDQVLVLPLHLKDKVAALVYADAGANGGGKVDAAALEVLVAATSAWLEVASLRKQAAKESATEAPAAERNESATAAQAANTFSDPFAGHAPRHAMAAPPAVEEPAAAAAEVVPTGAGAAAAPARAPDTFAQLSPEDADVHRKAQRFARLLMDEIKLYNQAKVAEGRKNKDLYDRLKDDVEKSRATYQKRYGNTVAASADYFTSELIRSLAEDDVSLLGGNFRR